MDALRPAPLATADAGDEPVLDLRHLAAPEPLVRALEAIDALAPGATLTVLTPLMPLPLLERLGGCGHDVHARLMPDGTARLHVRTAT